MSIEFTNVMTWEEFASSLPRNAKDTEKLMAAICYRFETEQHAISDVSIVVSDYFRRARWPRPVNLSATANYCASKGWLSEAGRSDSQKLWKITKRGYDAIKAKMVEM